mmetsp:Transcript_46359/g.88497  ORF Transcript_46359/g.88497 Transcript_46359/m.88497 type:complete len:1353 (-) Transcript_46359:72-4130(-)
MMRGAQSGGVVTYLPAGHGGMKGCRSRVVNKKRTDLSLLLSKQLKWDVARRCLFSGPVKTPAVFSGHTRFATSSVANLSGTHPHQWMPPSSQPVWSLSPEGQLLRRMQNVEMFVTHNGDFEFLKVEGNMHPVDSVQEWLTRVLGVAPPSLTDSCAIAGLMDLLRTQGLWFASIRYASVCWDVADLRDSFVMGSNLIQSVAEVMDQVFAELMHKTDGFSGHSESTQDTKERVHSLRALLPQMVLPKLSSNKELLNHLEVVHFHNGMQATQRGGGKSASSFADGHDNTDYEGDASLRRASSHRGPSSGTELLANFVTATVDAFFNNDLLFAASYFLRCAKGSFGLCVTSSLDADKQVVLAARGQTMSMSVFPEQKLILFGSEQAAVKAAMERPAYSKKTEQYLDKAYRIDLNDLGGELVLVNWAASSQRPEMMSEAFAEEVARGEVQQATLMTSGRYAVVATVRQENLKSAIVDRVVPFVNNAFIQPLPPVHQDPIADDISRIPNVMKQIQNNWNSGAHLNNVSSWTFAKTLAERVKSRLSENRHSDQMLDLLITGQEVSLWAGEQFAADLHMCFPNLRIRTMSANKVLALYGLDYNAAATGFQFNEESPDLSGAVVLVVSHSGGTFAPLAVTKLLISLTPSIFAVTGDWDTQISRAIREQNQSMFESRVMISDAGILPAEPCSLSLVATHQTLTQLLLYLMRYFSSFVDPAVNEATGAVFYKHDMEELATMNANNVACMEEIVGSNVHGNSCPSKLCESLRNQGRIWSQHILEAPISWILSFTYIMVTVVASFPLVYGICAVCGADSLSVWPWLSKLALVLDGLIYVFLPLWTTILIRLIQGRHWLHRLGTRAIVIGDIPWVSQSLDQFVSKLFARSYSISTPHVYSGNPADQLVHKFTHRVSRGTLLAVGRPDGRCNALAGAENAVCLAVNQASSIQHLGVCCESITVGHNNFKLPLSQAHIVLHDHGRPTFISERIMAKSLDRGISPSTIIGLLQNIKAAGQEEMDASCASLDDAPGIGESADASTRSLKALTPTAVLKRSASVLEMHVEQNKYKVRSSQSARSLDVNQDVPEHFGFGQKLQNLFPEDSPSELMEKQALPQRLYETRIASMQRCVAFMTMFHEMGLRVQQFWPMVSCGFLRYDMDRTQSIMRIATTASPVSGMDVQDMMLHIAINEQRARIMETVIRVAKFWRKVTHDNGHRRMKQQLSSIEMKSPAESSNNANGQSNLYHRSGTHQVATAVKAVQLDAMVADIVRGGCPGSVGSSMHASVHYRSVHSKSVHSVSRSSHASTAGALSGSFPISPLPPTAAELTGVTSDDVIHASRLRRRRRRTADMPAHGRTSNRVSFEQN